MNRALFSAAELVAATGGFWRNDLIPQGSFAINTDSRTIQEGECFVPIVGERFDGHDFLDKLPAGVIALSNSNRITPPTLPVLEVADTLLAYQQIAKFHRLRMKNLQIASVTGSVGKTSVKEMLRAIFTEAVGAEHVLYTLGNTNNQIGVPQNLLRLTDDICYAVIEMGTNHHGEIAPLSACALPDGALINTIAACHLEHLGDLDGVAKEKSAIYSAMTPAEGIAVYPCECAGKAIIEKAAASYKNFTFGGSDSLVSSEYVSGSLNGSTVKLNFNAIDHSETFDWELTGAHQAANAAAAATLATAFGIKPEVIARGLSKTTLPGKRMNSVEFNGSVWINDAYNANPHSMKSSLECIKSNLPSDTTLILVLGDMLELGCQETAYHREILDFVKNLFNNTNYQLLLLGNRFAQAVKLSGEPPANWQNFSDLSDLQDALKSIVRPGCTVFLKSSNSIALSKVEPC